MSEKKKNETTKDGEKYKRWFQLCKIHRGKEESPQTMRDFKSGRPEGRSNRESIRVFILKHLIRRKRPKIIYRK